MTVNESDAAPPEPMASVPVSELRKLAELLAELDIDLADDLVAGLANRVLRNLARRWADTVSVWAVEAELWGGAATEQGRLGQGAGRLDDLSEDQLAELIRLAAKRLASRQQRPPGDVLAELAREGG